MPDDLRPPYRIQFDNARDPYSARNALGITSLGGSGGFITSVTAPLAVTGGNLTIDLSGYQPLDADLTAIAALTGTNVIYYRSAANTWTAVTIGTGLSFTGGTLASTVTAGAPVGAEYITSTADPTLTSERVLTDTATVTWDRTTAGQIKATAIAAGSDTGVHCGRLTFVSTTALSFKPYNGDRIKINGVIYAIPSAGIVGLANTSVFVNGVAGQNLTADNVYWVYAFNNAGVITADFVTASTHAASTTAGNIGTEIKSGDNTRTLIGLVRTTVASQFRDDGAFRGVLSWFNRRSLSLTGASTAGATTASAVLVELTTAARVYFLTWSDEAVLMNLEGAVISNSAGAGSNWNIGLNGVAPTGCQQGLFTHYSTTAWTPAALAWSTTVSEGAHYLTVLGAQQTVTTGTFYIVITGATRG